MARTKETLCLLGDIGNPIKVRLIRGKNSGRGIPDWRCMIKCPFGRDNSRAQIDPENGLKVELGSAVGKFGVKRCPVEISTERKHS